MKIMLIFLTIFIFSACAKKEWSKGYLTEKCNDDFKKRNEVEKEFTASELVLLCDCVAGKMFDNYKSEAEADKDSLGIKLIGSDCVQQVRSQ